MGRSKVNKGWKGGRERGRRGEHSYAGVIYTLYFPCWNNGFEAELGKTSKELAGSQRPAALNPSYLET